MSNKVDALLRDAVREAEGKLRGLSDEEAARRPEPEKWSAKEILGHLIDSAANNHQRFVRARHSNELSIVAYNQNAWVRCQNYPAADWSTLVDLWVAYNKHLAHIIANIEEGEWETPIRIGDADPITLEFLVHDYLRHLKHHLGRLYQVIGD